MGSAMARNVRKRMASTGRLYIFDVCRSACERFQAEGEGAGAVVVVSDSAREAVEQAATVISIVPTAADVRQVYLDEATGVMAATRIPDRLILECSTIDAESARSISQALQEAGAGLYIDTPVSGGVPGAENGTLAFLLGHHGPPADANDTPNKEDPVVRRLERVCSWMGDPSRIFYCGRRGAGLAAKISNNYLSCSILVAVAEAMAIGVRSGVDAQLLHEVIHASTGQSFMADHVQPVPGVVSHAPSSNHYRLGFKTQMMTKDLGLGVQAGYATGIAPSMAEAALRVYEKAALDPQCIDRDGSSVFLYLTTRDPTRRAEN
ncbi:putative 3-hydroxyisobutyrate dehydrogenase [Aspergillus indologenus CBS 114.80]|uniref:3-hydroxyisobutyrate dehydrogenase n=1 Tax=Aspergillus indologenus CBS 114.80 TaxID=1450541 RepID=A0A2V5HVJ7_9EURO|nr:putative 3-hydroxyisobutyrate dehydrogenase [Aspergillus indologenus CBS 114.80]